MPTWFSLALIVCVVAVLAGAGMILVHASSGSDQRKGPQSAMELQVWDIGYGDGYNGHSLLGNVHITTVQKCTTTAENRYLVHWETSGLVPSSERQDALKWYILGCREGLADQAAGKDPHPYYETH